MDARHSPISTGTMSFVVVKLQATVDPVSDHDAITNNLMARLGDSLFRLPAVSFERAHRQHLLM